MADIINVSGMILSAMPVGEYDRRLIILTRECGKISVFAKAARKPNSQLIGITRPFIFGSFELYRGRDSYTMYKAEVKAYFEEVTSDLDAVCYAYYFAEIADYYARENLDATEMLNLLYVSLKALTNPNINNELVRFIYELRIIAVNGECPDFFTCIKCGNEEQVMMFSIINDGMICKKCANKTDDGISISGSTLYTLQYIVTSDLKRLYTFIVSKEVFDELRMVVNRITDKVFEKEFKSKKMLDM